MRLRIPVPDWIMWILIAAAAVGAILWVLKKLGIYHGADLFEDVEEELFFSAAAGDLEAVKAAEKAGQPTRGSTEDQQQTLLMGAAGSGSLDLVRYLVEELKVNVNAADLDDWTALMYAANEPSELRLETLAKEKGWDLSKNPEYRSRLLKELEKDSLAVAEYLLEHGAKADRKANNNWTALMFAVRRGSLKLVKFFESLGLDITAKDDEDWTAMMFAARSGSVELMKYLEGNRGLNILDKDPQGWSVLMFASRGGSLEMVKYLVEKYNWDVNENTGELSVLMAAAMSGSLETVQYLVEKGADVKAKIWNDRTADIWGSNPEVKTYLQSRLR